MTGPLVFARLGVLLLSVVALGLVSPTPRGHAQQSPPPLGSWVLNHPTQSPIGRTGAGLAYDPTAKSVLLFGGQDAPHHVLDDTWTWNGVSGVWSQRRPAARPSARCCFGMAYDQQRANMVLFGGSDGADHSFQDTWLWDGSGWAPVVAPGGPSARSGAVMAYDEARHETVLFGGIDQNGNLLNDTWLWDGVNWTQAQPATSPPGRTGGAFAYNPLGKTAVLFGGCCATGVDVRVGPFLGDTWTWDGSGWTQQQPASSPSARIGGALAYDPILASMLLFGGCSAQTSCRLGDGWLWDGSNWTLQQAPAGPPGRTGAAMATDGASNTIVLLGGLESGQTGNDTYGADTWSWIGQLPAGQPGP
jgi:hypothetical protein